MTSRPRRALTRRKRLNPVSRKLRANKRAYDAVYAAVDARSGGRCEAILPLGDWWRLGRSFDGWRAYWLMESARCKFKRCLLPATDHCHTRKPRRSPQNHQPHLIWHGCHQCHEWAGEARPFAKGRIVVTPRGDGTFECKLVTARDKWEARG